MNPNQACTRILLQLRDLVNDITVEDFSKSNEALHGSTVGQHVRHTLEFFLCLESALSCGVVNYDRRAHDTLMETDKFISLAAIERIIAFVDSTHADQNLMLEAGYAADETCFRVETNFTRELIYNIEHAVHHMAIIKLGIRHCAPYVRIPADFGVAASTVRHHNAAFSRVNENLQSDYKK